MPELEPVDLDIVVRLARLFFSEDVTACRRVLSRGAVGLSGFTAVVVMAVNSLLVTSWRVPEPSV